MVAAFVVAAPVVEIEDGLVHVTWGEGCESYWKPSTFRAFITQGAFELATFEQRQHGALPFRARG